MFLAKPNRAHMYLIGIVIIGILLFLIGIISILQEKNKLSQSQELPYKIRESVFNRSEEAFFIELKKQIPQDFYIFPKMRIIDFIDQNSTEYSWRNKIWAKHVDFLICNKDFKPVLAIEVNGGSHNSLKRIERDKKVSEIYKHAKLQFETIKVGESFENEIKRIIDNLKNY